MKLDPATIQTLEAWYPAALLAEVRVVVSGPVCWFVGTVLRQGAMAFAPYVFYGRSRFDPAAPALPLLAHEIKHVEQYRRHGHASFLARYFLDLARNRFRYSERLPLEAEACAIQARVEQSLNPI